MLYFSTNIVNALFVGTVKNRKILRSAADRRPGTRLCISCVCVCVTRTPSVEIGVRLALNEGLSRCALNDVDAMWQRRQHDCCKLTLTFGHRCECAGFHRLKFLVFLLPRTARRSANRLLLS